MERIINAENYRSFAYVNDKIINGKIKGVVVRFHGLGGQDMFSDDTYEGKLFAERGILLLHRGNKCPEIRHLQAVLTHQSKKPRIRMQA